MLADSELRRIVWRAMRLAGFDPIHGRYAVDGALMALRRVWLITGRQELSAERWAERVLDRHEERRAKRDESGGSLKLLKRLLLKKNPSLDLDDKAAATRPGLEVLD